MTKPIADAETENGVAVDKTNTQNLFLTEIYARDYSIQIEAGVNSFCGFIDLETTHRLSVIYRVTFYLGFKEHLQIQYL